jgi:hypothetical protein
MMRDTTTKEKVSKISVVRHAPAVGAIAPLRRNLKE